MTPDALRAVIASARLRPRMYGTDAHDLSGYLHGLTAGVYDGPLNVAAQWQRAWTTAGWRPNDPRADAVVCDVADRVVAALWPQGDAPARPCAACGGDGGHGGAESAGKPSQMPCARCDGEGTEPAALSPARRAAEAGALDLDAIEARARKRIRPCEGGADGRCGAPCARRCNAGGDCGIERCDAHAVAFSDACDHDWYPIVNGANDTLALVARVRELEAEATDMREGVAYAGASCDREIQVHGVWLRASRRGPPSDVRHYAEVAAARDEALAEVERLRAQLAAAQPAPLDFYAALAAVRNGPFVPPSTWVRCLACGGTRADVDGAPCEPCRGTGRQPPPSDADLCPKSAATVAGEAFAAEHPYAAGALMGGVAKMEADDGR